MKRRTGIVTALAPPQRVVASFQINPVNGNIVALCNDGTLWIRPGTLESSLKPWKRINDASLIDQPVTLENEDAITTVV
jgi:hypothetical protein